ncbi:hypothetical protein D3C75_1187190 [compost metagenome]
MIMALLQLIIGQADTFTAEHQRYRRMFTFVHGADAAFARFQHRPRQGARTRTGAHDQTAAGNGVIQSVNNSGVADHVAGTSGQGDRLRIRFYQRINQIKVG